MVSLSFTCVCNIVTVHHWTYSRAPSCPEIPEISQFSWNCPEISNHLVRMSWYGPLLCCCYTFFTSNDYVYIADVELYCFMCNIALVTFLGLQYWSASMINIYEHRKTCYQFLCPEPRETDKSFLKLSWNFLKIWSWNFTCCWEPWYSIWYIQYKIKTMSQVHPTISRHW